VRDDLAAQRAANGTAVALARSRADIALQQTVRAGSDGTVHVFFDIVDNTMSSLHGEGADVARVNLARGYADTRLERDVSEDPTSYGTIALFENSGTAATQVVADASGAQTLRVSPELRDGLDQTFARGEVALAPAQPVALDGHDAFGWWAVDPATGNSVGRMTGARGGAMSEYTLVMRVIAFANFANSSAQVSKRCFGGSSFSDAGCAIALCGLVGAAILCASSAASADILAKGTAAVGGGSTLFCQMADTVFSP
jgi:hypothetical protein